MGIRGEVFSTKVSLPNGKKTYFFNIKENRNNDLYLNIVESARKEHGGFNRFSIMVFSEDFVNFNEQMVKAFKKIEEKEDDYSSSFQNETGNREYEFLIQNDRFRELVLIERKSTEFEQSEKRSLRIEGRDIREFEKEFLIAAHYLIKAIS